MLTSDETNAFLCVCVYEKSLFCKAVGLLPSYFGNHPTTDQFIYIVSSSKYGRVPQASKIQVHDLLVLMKLKLERASHC